MKNPYLVGNRLYLRPFELADASVAAAWLNDPEVNQTLLYHRPMSTLMEQDWIQAAPKDEKMLPFLIALRNDDKPIGAVGLIEIDSRNRQSCFGLMIGDRDSWGNGYGTEASQLLVDHGFETLNLHRIWLEVYEYNAAAQRVYEKIGFQREGVLRQDNFRHGRYWDTYIYGILRDEWQARRL